MISGSVCLSHAPLMDKNRADPDVEKGFNRAIEQASRLVAQWKPDLAVVFFPDHFNGFFYDLMPSFCVGAAASSIGDYGSIPGNLDVPEEVAVAIATHAIRSHIDMALSYRMQVDHGAMQPIELLSSVYPITRVVPIFINCAAPPLPGFARVRAMAGAVGAWAMQTDQKVLFIASGGLSHDPPVAAIAGASPEVRARLIDGRGSTHAARLTRQSRVYTAGSEYKAGTTSLQALNPEWDRAFADALIRGDLAVGDRWTDREITERGGRGAHEVRTWIAALAALSAGGGYAAALEFYEPVAEWITGIGLMTATPRQAA